MHNELRKLGMTFKCKGVQHLSRQCGISLVCAGYERILFTTFIFLSYDLKRRTFKNAHFCKSHQKLISTQSQRSQFKKKQLRHLGFTVGNLPNKEWLISVLYALNPMDQVFLKPKIEDVGLVAKEDLELLKQLDTTHFRSKKPGFLKRTGEQRIEIAEKKSEQKLQRLKVDKKRFDLAHSTNQYEKQFEMKQKAKKDQRQG